MGWGLGTAEPSVAATEAIAPVAAITSGKYTFTKGMRKVEIYNLPSSGQDLWIKWNADAAGKADNLFNEVIEPGCKASFPDENGAAIVHKLGLWIDGALTYGTDYTIQGWE